jgi:hypothetical protein
MRISKPREATANVYEQPNLMLLFSNPFSILRIYRPYRKGNLIYPNQTFFNFSDMLF